MLEQIIKTIIKEKVSGRGKTISVLKKKTKKRNKNTRQVENFFFLGPNISHKKKTTNKNI